MKHLFLLFSAVLVIFGCSTNNNGTVTVVPLAPTNLTGAVISNTQINLSWTDNATNEEGYKIERKTGAGNYAVVGSSSSNMTSFSDLGLSPSTSYTYRVYAYNSAGNSLQYSNELTLSTQDSIPSWLTNGLVAYYPFNGNANDESGNGNNGTVNGATLTSDRNGINNKSYSTTSGYISCINNNIPTNNPISISFWFKCNSDFGIGEVISLGSPSSTTWGCVIGNNYFTMNYGRGCGSTGSSPASIGLSNTNWHNVVFISNGIGGNSSIYYDGVFSANTINANTNGGCSTSNLYFGADIFSLVELFDGSLDDIRIYNRALSASEVAYLAAH